MHKLVKLVCKELKVHTEIEERIFYPAVIEHGSAKTLIQHHVKEEESEMFPKARRARLNRRALGEKLLARKARLMGI